jgi:regulator of sigma E protease
MSVSAMVNTFKALFSSSDVKAQHLSGPVGIMRIYYVLFESEQGWRQAIWFSVILNVNLALLNLLPIPVLDGGHILLALVEWVRRRPVGTRFLLILQNGCALLIIGYMLYVTFFDIQDLPWKRSKTTEITFPAPNAGALPGN